jgi:hypothetical protein
MQKERSQKNKETIWEREKKIYTRMETCTEQIENKKMG